MPKPKYYLRQGWGTMPEMWVIQQAANNVAVALFWNEQMARLVLDILNDLPAWAVHKQKREYISRYLARVRKQRGDKL